MQSPTFTAFAGPHLLASGPVKTVLLAAKTRFDTGEVAPLLIFDDRTGKQIDFDFEGTPEIVLAKLAAHPLFQSDESLMPPRTGPGRPRLGVVGREVSLLPRHWEWLEGQPQGASAAIRRLVEEAAKREPDKDRARKAREAVGNFMWAVAGNLPNFEEASRALYAGDNGRFDAWIREWPRDIQEHMRKMLRESGES
jgi:hypothetical protein